MKFEELEIAVKGGWTVYYKTKGNLVVTEKDYNFTFPYSDYAVRWYDGCLSYICPYEGTDDDFFVGERT